MFLFNIICEPCGTNQIANETRTGCDCDTENHYFEISLKIDGKQVEVLHCKKCLFYVTYEPLGNVVDMYLSFGFPDPSKLVLP